MPILKPLANESQPEFAVRFHEAAKSDIPNTDERNSKMLEMWDRYGSEVEKDIADNLFDADLYQVKRNIAIFAEHENPERVDRNGRTIPAERYTRDTLASIAQGHNYRIRDNKIFPPITDGHTSPNRNDPKPTTVGFSGTARLGMIGNEKPRWAIFHDEYTRKDAENLLKEAPGRSVEVLRHPDLNQRKFYPIAALRADAPRLDLPPARYSMMDNIECPIDFYQFGGDVDVYMSMPGGSNTFTPGFGENRDKYGDDSDGPLMSSSDWLEQFKSSAIGSVFMKYLEQEGKNAVKPLVQQVLPAADEQDEVPADQPLPGVQPPPAADGSGQLPAGQPAQEPPQAPAMQQTQKPMQMGSGQPDAQQPAVPQQDSGATHTHVHIHHQKGSQMPEQYETDLEVDRYAAIEERVEELEERNSALQRMLAAQTAKNMRMERKEILSAMADHYQFDIDAELERVDRYSNDQFTAHVEVIENNYRRRPEAPVEDFAAHAAVTDRYSRREQAFEPDIEEVIQYATEHAIDNYMTAREAIIKSHKA
jgi:hypothetical protein